MSGEAKGAIASGLSPSLALLVLPSVDPFFASRVLLLLDFVFGYLDLSWFRLLDSRLGDFFLWLLGRLVPFLDFGWPFRDDCSDVRADLKNLLLSVILLLMAF